MADKAKAAAPADGAKSSEGAPAEGEEKKEEDPKTMPIQDYLEATVVPLLLEGCRIIAVDRPPDPIESLAKFLLEKDPQSPRNIKKAAEEAEAKKKADEEKAAAEGSERKPSKKPSIKK